MNNIKSKIHNTKFARSPMSREDLILLLELACKQFKYINALQANIIESGKIAEAARAWVSFDKSMIQMGDF